MNKLAAQRVGATTPAWVDDIFAVEYEQGMEFFFAYLVELNVNIYIVDHVLQFPIELFSDGDVEKSIFLVQVVDNFLEQSILIITKLVADQGRGQNKQVYTLRQFRNKVVRFAKPEFKDQLQQQLRQINFQQKTSALLEKAEKLRDWSIAHFTPGFFQESFDRSIQVERLRFTEVKTLCTELNVLYQVLTFGAECIMLPDSYMNNVSDIERILDSVAKDSIILNMPEQHPDWWKYEQEKLTEEELRQLKHYRKKFGMVEL